MIQGLLGGGELEESVVERVVEAAEGNPLFAEQLLRMLTDEGLLELQDGRWRATSDLSEIHVPPTIQALLASRLDTLSAEQRSVIEPASVVGYEFAEGAVTALAPPDISPRVRAELATLGHKHLVRPVEDGDEGMHRFHHIMIRDTAYDGILKRARADLHARFVAWADLVNQDRATEFEEILGYHLEQAWTYLSELGPLDERGREIGQEGSRRLAAAGRRAFARGDVPSAVALLGRAVALLPADDPERIRLLPDHGEALLMTGRYEEASAVLDEAIEHAAHVPTAAARASLHRLLVRLRAGEDEWRRETVDAEIDAAKAIFDQRGDEAGLALAYRLLAWSAGIACRFGDSAAANAKAVEHARLAGDLREERRALMAYAGAISLGPTNVDEAIARCEEGLEATAGNRQSEGILLALLGGLYAMQGAFDRARELVARGRNQLEELGLDMVVARVGLEAWRTELFAGNFEAAERELRRSYETLDARGERYLLSTVTARLAQTILEGNGALDEAEAMGNRSRELATDSDIETQALWRSVRGRILSRRGEHDEAEAMIREALAVLEPTDFTMLQLDVQFDLGDVLVAAGRIAEARAAYDRARELATTKGAVVPLGAVLRRLEELDTAPLNSSAQKS
jgi:predicted ATPase